MIFMENIIKASIIITTYNRPKFLERAIYSCKNQSTQYGFEIIVVDDNGIGKTAQIETASLVDEIGNVKYIALEKNSGACVARNEGANIASGDYLFFLDDDDKYLPNKLQEQISFLETHNDLDGCLASFKRFDKNDNEIMAASNYAVVGDFKNFVLDGNFFTPMLCIRKNSFTKSGGFIDIARFQDRFYMMNMLKEGFKFWTLDKQLHVMYEHNEGRITSTSHEKTSGAITKILSWLSNSKNEFTLQEWTTVVSNSQRQIAVSYYMSDAKSDRQIAARLYWNIYLKSLKFSDFMMILKSLVK